MTVRRPFGELDLCNQLWFEPHTVFRLFFGQGPLGSLLSGRLANGQELTSAFRPAFRTRLRILLRHRLRFAHSRKGCAYGPGNPAHCHFLAASRSFKPTEKGNFSSSNSSRTTLFPLGTRTRLSEIAAIDCQCHADDEGCSIRAQPDYRVCNLFRVA